MSAIKDNPERRALITKMRGEGLTHAAIAKELKIDRGTVYWYAPAPKPRRFRGRVTPKPKTFNLVLREPKRDPTNAMKGFQKWARTRREERKEDEQRHVELQGLSTVGEDLPVCMVCSGRSLTWDGHPGCRGRW